MEDMKMGKTQKLVQTGIKTRMLAKGDRQSSFAQLKYEADATSSVWICKDDAPKEIPKDKLGTKKLVCGPSHE